MEKQKILIVEDEASQRKALVDKFMREGFSALQAMDGQQGLTIALRERPDLILLDIVMPVMDGMTMMQKVRGENAWGKAVPIILLTNLTGDDERLNRSITENEPAYYLVKSNWTIDDVVGKVRERLSRTS